MTPAEIETMARSRYNATGDTNWSSEEIAGIIYQACLEITRDCGLVIERLFQSATVAGTSEYEWPAQASAIKRVTVGGRKLREISMREDDTLTIENQLTTDTGLPEYYYVWNRTINMRPIPQSAETLQVFAICAEQELTPTSTIDIPEQYHGSLVTYVIKEMSAKDLNWQMFDRYQGMWDDEKNKIRAHIRRAKRADAFAIVKSEEMLPYQTLGVK
jgi:hypothetical protein